MADATPEPEERVIFNMLDKDSSGNLDKDELWCKLAVKGDAYADQLIGMVDKNGDGVIDFDEFCAAFKDVKDFKGLVTANWVDLGEIGGAIETAMKNGKIPFVCDPSGKADSFLTYNGNDLDAKGTFVLDKIHKKKTPEEITEDTRKFFVSAMKHGQRVNVKMGKSAPGLGDHLAGFGADGDHMGVFQAGFGTDIAQMQKVLVKDEDLEQGIWQPRGGSDWEKYGIGIVVSTQFEREDFEEFLSGSWPGWPWQNFQTICVKQD